MDASRHTPRPRVSRRRNGAAAQRAADSGPATVIDGPFLTRSAHFLKNGAAAAKAAAHLLSAHGGQADAATRGRWRDALGEAVEGLRRALNQLEALGQALTPGEPGTDEARLATWLEERVRRARESEPAAKTLLAVGRVPAGRWRFAAGPAAVALDCLLANALVHPPPGARATVSARATAGGLAFTVVDDGPGIPPGEIDGLFTPFFRGAAAQGRPGAGLGLTLARAAATRAGGRVTLRRNGPRGAHFELFLPARRLPRPRTR